MTLSTQPTFTIEQAAKFLDVSVDRVHELIRDRTLRLWGFKGQSYILGGELDMCKTMMRPLLPAEIDSCSNE